MCSLQAPGYLDCVSDGLIYGKRAVGDDHLLERLPLDVLEDDEWSPVLFTGVDHGNQVRITQSSCRFGFLAKPLELVVGSRYLPVQELDCDRPVEGEVDCEINGGHTSATEFRLDPVALYQHRSDYLFGLCFEHAPSVDSSPRVDVAGVGSPRKGRLSTRTRRLGGFYRVVTRF